MGEESATGSESPRSVHDDNVGSSSGDSGSQGSHLLERAAGAEEAQEASARPTKFDGKPSRGWRSQNPPINCGKQKFPNHPSNRSLDAILGGHREVQPSSSRKTQGVFAEYFMGGAGKPSWEVKLRQDEAYVSPFRVDARDRRSRSSRPVTVAKARPFISQK